MRRRRIKGRIKGRVKRYLMRTWKQKLYALAIILFGGVLTTIVLSDATGLLFTLLIGIPMFLTSKKIVD